MTMRPLKTMFYIRAKSGQLLESRRCIFAALDVMRDREPGTQVVRKAQGIEESVLQVEWVVLARSVEKLDWRMLH